MLDDVDRNHCCWLKNSYQVPVQVWWNPSPAPPPPRWRDPNTPPDRARLTCLAPRWLQHPRRAAPRPGAPAPTQRRITNFPAPKPAPAPQLLLHRPQHHLHHQHQRPDNSILVDSNQRDAARQHTPPLRPWHCLHAAWHKGCSLPTASTHTRTLPPHGEKDHRSRARKTK